MKKPTLVVLAAWMWSRYWWLKQIDPIWPNNEVIIDYSIFDAIRTWFWKVVFIIRRDIEADFKNFFWNKFESIIDVEYVYQELTSLPVWFSVPEWRQKPRWTAHALLMVKDIVDGPFAVINADDFYGKDAFEKITQFFSANVNSNTYALVWYYLKNTISDFWSVNRGVCTSKDSKLLNIVETKNISTKDATIWFFDNETWKILSPETLVSMNFFGFMPSIFSYIEEWFINFLKKHWEDLTAEYFIPSVLDDLIKSNTIQCNVLSTDAPWFWVTYQEDKPQVVESIKKLIENGEYPQKLWG